MRYNCGMLPRKPNRFVFLILVAAILGVSACNAGPDDSGPRPPLTATEQRGLDLFNIHCASCHATAPGTIIVGPSLDGIAARAGQRVEGMNAEAYIRTSILKPGAYIVKGFDESMPPDLGKRLSGEEFDAILAYLLTLQ